jgi:hypothetical protein
MSLFEDFAAIAARDSLAGEKTFGGLPLLPGMAARNGPGQATVEAKSAKRANVAGVRVLRDAGADFAQPVTTLLSGIDRIMGAQSM